MKINEDILNGIKLKCYEILLHGMIDSDALAEAKKITEKYLESAGVELTSVKCDYENNPPDVIDSGNVYVDITEQEFSGSQSYFKHRVEL